ncbi:hypothetical protein HGP14_23865 [Rhizobium sp. P32RR-XVIII]|nr:hypothetical protein [Rhizobium sp. P32RR-XVIII]NLS06352.1 hypothetical protein [Rhizobium sp. P32RR-XVIII]
MSYLIEILLPRTGESSRANFDVIRSELTENFGGATMHVNAPAEGLWEGDGSIEEDRIVVVEVMIDELDRAWWTSYRKDLEVRLHQEEIVIRATRIERL